MCESGGDGQNTIIGQAATIPTLTRKHNTHLAEDQDTYTNQHQHQTTPPKHKNLTLPLSTHTHTQKHTCATKSSSTSLRSMRLMEQKEVSAVVRSCSVSSSRGEGGQKDVSSQQVSQPVKTRAACHDVTQPLTCHIHAQ